MNINFSATCKFLTPNGKELEHYEAFNAFQTPTVITRKICAGADFDAQAELYKEWAMIDASDEQEPIHDIEQWDKTTEYYKIIGYKTVNFRKDHCVEFDAWIAKAKENGLTLYAFEM